MSETSKKPDDITQEEWDASDLPEWTEADFARAKPFAEVFPEQFATWKKKGGRPPAGDQPKTHVGFRLDTSVVEGIRATGKGYNARVESVLREALAAGKLDAPRDLLGDSPKR